MSQEIRGGLEVTTQQARVVDQVLSERFGVVSAGAGSGKTRTTVATVLELLGQRRATIDQFILITFTNKAADELRERVELGLAECLKNAVKAEQRCFWLEQQERLAAAFIGTIHGFCTRILRTFGYTERVARELDVSFTRFRLIESFKDVVEEYSYRENAPLIEAPLTWEEYDLRKFAERIYNQIRNKNLTPKQILNWTHAQPEDSGKIYRIDMATLLVNVEERYQQRKREEQALDSGDLLEKVAHLLEGSDGEEIVNRLGERYQYLFVDEFQDTDRVQKRIIDTLKNKMAGLLVVGDKKQSIYGFRAADVSLLSEIARENGVPILPLSISRRPTRALLNTQNALFASMAQRYLDLGEPLEPWEGAINSDSLIPPMTYVDAGKGVKRPSRIQATASQIRLYLDQQIEDPKTKTLRSVEQGDIAILVRSNFLLTEYEQLLPRFLQDTVIIVKSDTGGNFFQCSEIVATYHMLRLLLNFPNDTILSLALLTPYLSQANPNTEEHRIIQYGTRQGYLLTDWLEQHYEDYTAHLKKLRGMVRTATVPQILSELYRLFEIQTIYRQRGNQQAVDNLDKLREMARQLFQNEQALTLHQFTAYIGRAILSEQEESEAEGEEQPDNHPNHVRIMTIHQSKGLEFPLVIIPEVQSPLSRKDMAPEFLLIPGYGLDLNLSLRGAQTASERFFTELEQTRQDRLDEEMRVFYVAVTRAQHAVAFVGSGPLRKSTPDSEFYSWKDEILQAWPNLSLLGAQLVQ